MFVCLNFPSFWSSWPTLTCEVLELPCFITSLFKIRELGISCVYLMNLFHCCPKLSVHMRVVLERSEFYDYDFFNWSERHEPKEKGFDQRNGLSRPKKISTAVITLLKVVITSDITGVFFQDCLHLGDRILQKDCNRLPCIEPRKLRLRDAGVDIFSSGLLRNIS